MSAARKILLVDSPYKIRVSTDAYPAGIDIEDLDDPAVDDFFSDLNDAIEMAMQAVKNGLSEKYPDFLVEVR